VSASEVVAYVRDRGPFCGTAQGITETIDEFIELGCRAFMAPAIRPV
jgi:hypothetical protein